MANPRFIQLVAATYTDVILSRQFRLAKQVFDVITNRPDYQRILLEDLALEVAYQNNIPHGLNRKPTGWRITQQDNTAEIYEVETASDNRYLVLNTSGDVNVSVEVW